MATLRTGVVITLSLGILATITAASECTSGATECNQESDMNSLLQLPSSHIGAVSEKQSSTLVDADPKRNLVFMHIPYNFGHTVEVTSLFPGKILPDTTEGFNGNGGGMPQMVPTWPLLEAVPKRKNYEVWGHLNPDLQVKSDVTGCGLYYTPPKYWPKDMAEKYFGTKELFGMLRDPYERLIAFFRGGFKGYGSTDETMAAAETCDVNTALTVMMTNFLNGTSGDYPSKFASDCTFVPQAEYFCPKGGCPKGEYGITVPVDNRRFPVSMNEVFANNNYEDFFITKGQIEHVRGCDNVWAADLNSTTRSLIRQVYADDFALLCSEFGYCNDEENVCLTEIPNMCPPKAFTWDDTKQKYFAK